MGRFDVLGGVVMISSAYNKEKQVHFITLKGVTLLEEVELLYQTIVSSSDYPPENRSF